VLNPLVGIGVIVRMGGVYWEAAVIYSVVALAAWAASLPLALVPVAGLFLKAFVDAYAYLMIGCVLGLAVFKKARELDLE
jgi:hypothetical protein